MVYNFLCPLTRKGGEEVELEKITPSKIVSLKGKRKIVSVTAYDYPSAYFADQAGMDFILVGDSLGMVIKGEENTLGVRIEEMAYHIGAVAKGTKRALIVGDMPFLSFISPEEAIKNAGLLIRAGAEAVKIEGPRIEVIRALVREGIPVMGHVGLTPQHFLRIGFRTQGKKAASALELYRQAKEIERAGAFSIVLESVPFQLAHKITSELSIPTIGIGAGPYCDGQILVFHDLLGLYPGKKPSFVREYARLGEEIVEALRLYSRDVKGGEYPSHHEAYSMDEEEYRKFMEEINGSYKENFSGQGEGME